MRTYIGFFVGISLILAGGATGEARVPEPETVPMALKGTSPHTPLVAVYYLQEFVKQGKITKDEAERIEVYMIFRNARRMQDLKEVEGLDKTTRRAVMKHKRELRGNPLKEFSDHCGFSLERAKALMDLLHGSDKGTAYYEKYKTKK